MVSDVSKKRLNKKEAAEKSSKRGCLFSIDKDLLIRLDELAEKLYQSRSTIISLAIIQCVENGLNIGGLEINTLENENKKEIAK